MRDRLGKTLAYGAFAIAATMLLNIALYSRSEAQGKQSGNELIKIVQKLQLKVTNLEERGRESIPLGAVVAFTGPKTEIPKKWVACEGQTLRKDLYPELFKTIGTIYGGQGGVNFRLPDYRGYFLRGATADMDPENVKKRDPDRKARQLVNGNFGPGLGSIQNDTYAKHYHPLGVREFTKGGDKPSKGFANVVDRAVFLEHGQNPKGPKPGYHKKEGLDAGFSDETRPKNVYVNWIIKVRP